MKLRKILAGALAAAMVTVAAPFSVTVSAEGYNVGDEFYAEFNSSTGEVVQLYDDMAYVLDGTYNAFYQCEVLDDKSIAVAVNCFLNSFIHEGESITIPSEINGYTVTEIMGCVGGYASITIPDTVKIFRESAFTSNFYLEEIKFGENSQLEVIGKHAFYDCRSLKSITIPATVKELGYGAFMNSNSRDFGSYAEFENMFSLTTVKFAEGSKLETIGEYAFQLQKGLESIEIPDGVTEIARGEFIGCESLAEVVIPDSVKEIGFIAFGGCTALAEIEIPDSVTAIGGKAFTECTSLTKIEIPNSVIEIGEDAFSDCSESLTIYGYASSTAEAFAKENNIAFAVLDEASEVTTATEAAPTTEPATTTEAVPTTDPAPSVGNTDGGNKTGDKQSADTGVEGVAVAAGVAIVAAAAIIITKKRK